MSTYTQILYHIVFSTKGRRPVLAAEGRQELFRYLTGVLRNNQCHLYRLNGVEDHLHILTSLHPTVALADLVKDLKVASAQWIKQTRVFPRFDGWQDGYGRSPFRTRTEMLFSNTLPRSKSITRGFRFVSSTDNCWGRRESN